jgi:hypothetical protein
MHAQLGREAQGLDHAREGGVDALLLDVPLQTSVAVSILIILCPRSRLVLAVGLSLDLYSRLSFPSPLLSYPSSLGWDLVYVAPRDASELTVTF